MWPSSPHVIDNLSALLELWLMACLICFAIFVFVAPSVALGILGSVIGLVVAASALRGGPIGGPLPVGIQHHGVPSAVPEGAALYASCGLLLFGAVGLFVTRPLASVRFLRGAAAAVLLAGALLSWYLASVLTQPCPGPHDPINWSCHASVDPYFRFDLIGSWGPNVVELFLFDALVVAVLLIVSAEKVRRRERVALSASRPLADVSGPSWPRESNPGV